MPYFLKHPQPVGIIATLLNFYSRHSFAPLKKTFHLFLGIVSPLCQEAGTNDRWWHHCEDSMHISKHSVNGCKQRVLSFEVLGHILSSHVLLNLKKTEPLPATVQPGCSELPCVP
jgi:hypothetical protein